MREVNCSMNLKIGWPRFYLFAGAFINKSIDMKEVTISDKNGSFKDLLKDLR